MIGVIIAMWAAFGLAAYAASVADFQRSFPDQAKRGLAGDRWFSLYIGVLGPAGLIAVFFFTASNHGRPFKHGFML